MKTGDGRRHHYVPRFFLKRFSNSLNGAAIGVYNLRNALYVRDARLKNQAYKKDFYGQDGTVERILADLEDKVAPVLNNIDTSRTLPSRLSSDHHLLLLYAVVQSARTMYARMMYDELSDKVLEKVLGHDPELRDVTPAVQRNLKLPMALGISAATSRYALALDLRYKLAISRSNIPFICSDNPVVFYNQFLEHQKVFGSTSSLAVRGLQVFYPISPQVMLLFYDHEVYRVGRRDMISVDVDDPHDIDALNRLQCISADENLYFNDKCNEGYIRDLTGSAIKLRRGMKMHVEELLPNDGTPNHSLLVSSRVDINSNLKVSFLALRRRARRYSFFDAKVPLRNDRLCRVHEVYCRKKREGVFTGSFMDFCRQTGTTID